MRGDRCRYVKRYEESLRAHFSDLCGRRGIVRLLNLVTGEAQVRWDDAPGELYPTRLTNLVREDHEGPDPLDETVIQTEVARLLDYSDEASDVVRVLEGEAD
jgi:hypothetical protein